MPPHLLLHFLRFGGLLAAGGAIVFAFLFQPHCHQVSNPIGTVSLSTTACSSVFGHTDANGFLPSELGLPPSMELELRAAGVGIAAGALAALLFPNWRRAAGGED